MNTHADVVPTNQPKPSMAVESVGQVRVSADTDALYPRSNNPRRGLQQVPTNGGRPGSMPFSPGPAHGAGGF